MTSMGIQKEIESCSNWRRLSRSKREWTTFLDDWVAMNSSGGHQVCSISRPSVIVYGVSLEHRTAKKG